MTEIVVADIGGTNARFALAYVEGHRVFGVAAETVLKAAEHASLQTAWEAFGAILGLPCRAAAIAVACPVGGDVLKLTNNRWIIRPALIPDQPLVATGVVSVVGPGTGLGVAVLVRDRRHRRRRDRGRAHRFRASRRHRGSASCPAPRALPPRVGRTDHRRTGARRHLRGAGGDRGTRVPPIDAPTLWAAALAKDDTLGVAALDGFCLSLGAVAGDIAVIQGGFGGVVVADGLGLRLAHQLPRSGFHQRFGGERRFESLMASIPVKILSHPPPGLFGAAAAFVHEHGAAAC